MQFRTIARKDLKVISRDRTAMIFTFGMPLILTFIFGSIGNRGSGTAGLPSLTIMVANQDTGADGAKLIDQMRKLSVNVIPAGSSARVETDVNKGAAVAGVVIPSDFSARLEAALQSPGGATAGIQSHIKVVIDPGQTQVQGIATGVITGAVKRTEALVQFPGAAAAMNDSPGRDAVALDVSRRRKSEPTVGDLFIPGFLVYFVFFLANGVAATLLYERQEGTLRRILGAPVTRFQILFGKLLARAILGFIQTVVLLLIGIFWMHLTVTSAPFGLFVAVCATIFSACGLGVLIATFGTTMEQIQGMTTMALLLLGFISGTLIPRALLPDSLVKLSYVTPHAWALNAYQDLILRHETLLGTLPNILAVVAFGAVFFAIALARFNFE